MRVAGAGARRTTVATALALAVIGTIGGGGAWAAAAGQSSPGDASAAGATSQTGNADWLPQTPADWPLVVDRTTTTKEIVTSGLQHYSETLDTVGGRQHIQVLNADLGNPNLRVGMVEAGDTLTNPADETTSSMAQRTNAVAGVNGGYFAINGSGVPDGGIMADGKLLKSPQPGYASQLGVKPDGTMVMGPETFSGTITDGTATHPLTSLNTVGDVASGGITEITPDLGSTSAAASTLVLGHTADGGFVVDSVQANVTTVPKLPAGRLGLLGAGAGGQWLTADVHTGDTVGIASKLSPDNDLTQMISGVDILVKDGKAYKDPTGTPPTGAHPETAVGITKDGKHAIVVTIDGEQGATVAFGVTPDQVAGYLLAHGAYTAELFDGGGSTTMATRAPGAAQAKVVNTPSDLPGNTERKVANGIFFYSAAKQAGPATKVVVNGGKTVTTVSGGSIPLPVYATDTFANPAAGQVKVRIEPSNLATYANGRLTPKRTGVGRIIATDGRVTTSEKLDVVSKLASLSVSPDQADLDNGATQQLTLTGTVKGGGPVEIPAEAATWTVPDGLGTVDAHGLFAASTDKGGLADVTAKVGGATATTSIAVGRVSKTIDPMDDANAWHLSNNTTGYAATVSDDPGVVPPGSTDSGSLKLTYTMPAGSGVKQLVIAPRTTIRTDTDNGQVPTGIGLWVKDGGPGSLELAESYINIDGTVNTPIYLTGVTSNGWRLAVTQLPAGMKFPLTVNWIDFLGINSSSSYTGTLNFAGLQALYSPRPVTTPTYQAIPQNPGWLSYEEDSADFAQHGSTLLTGDDAHMLAGDPGSVSSNVMDSIAKRLPTLTPQAKPDAAQFLGDMSDDGAPADLQYARSKMDELGIPERDIVGNHEITQGSDPENGNYSDTFGATHYSYAEGAANVIVTDNSHGSLQSSDPYQDPTGEQYPWLVQQLTHTTAKDVLVTTHMPAYDPHPAANSQFTDRWEAQMYMRLIQRFQQTHPKQHVVMVYGHARGFSEQILDPEGRSVTTAQGGIPQLTFADLGMPAYAPADQGGFYHYGLLRIGDDGNLQFSVEAALASITVQAPAAPLSAGDKVTMTATGDQIAGDNIAPLTIPIQDPASHVWTSSNPKVASVDRSTGVLTAHSSGTVTVSVTAGGVTGTTRITVK
ncbi:phosphodiester glycosidase family protein [Actinacidiphila acididurans]|uniref:Phosphodiester glycosidase family protein n=1 Tax=Actinacidiphila acididurans TaxID=2784346 RepID=A0ABS2U434_9ACTN|nr:phosphodiester glycosidase family protein [Actinacidiphila acididurans]MBM9510354.1 phosphodiester glycosidase family protein [Actinacidiphila acididurans]